MSNKKPIVLIIKHPSGLISEINIKNYNHKDKSKLKGSKKGGYYYE